MFDMKISENDGICYESKTHSIHKLNALMKLTGKREWEMCLCTSIILFGWFNLCVCYLCTSVVLSMFSCPRGTSFFMIISPLFLFLTSLCFGFSFLIIHSSKFLLLFRFNLLYIYIYIFIFVLCKVEMIKNKYGQTLNTRS